MVQDMRIARSAGLGTGTGSLKKIIMPSPVNRSSVPSWATIRRPISAWYSRRTSITSSGSEVSAKAVKPRRSRKTTVTSRRWVLRGSSAPPATISSASWGEKNRLSRPSRSSCAALSCACLRLRLRSSRCAAWARTVAYSSLMRGNELTMRASNSAGLTGLVRKSSMSHSRLFTRSCVESRAITDMV